MVKKAIWLVGALALLAVAGCGKSRSDTATTHHGRYVGIGIYPTGDLWQRMITAGPPANALSQAARLSDDEQVIVVVDSDTGEIRQCGNFSGYCVGANPWTKALVGQQQQPVALSAHNLKLPPIEPAPAQPEPDGKP